MHLGDLLWSLLVIFFMVIYFLIIFRVIVDIFRDHGMSGWAKAGWLIALLIFPLITVLIYVIARGSGMAQRDAAQIQGMQQAQDEYIRTVATSGDSAADQIAKAHDLLAKGAITQEEFDGLKAKALSA